jgi:hypothetical protein
MSHMASPSLGHYASLVFVVRGGGQRLQVGLWIFWLTAER